VGSRLRIPRKGDTDQACTTPQKAANGMTFHVAITYYNRPGMLHDLLCDIERERGDHEVRVHVYDDHSTSHINTDDLAHINKLVRFNTHGGKQKYYRSIQTALQDAHANPCDYIIFMQDDNRLGS
jgi:hypothetical protein